MHRTCAGSTFEGPPDRMGTHHPIRKTVAPEIPDKLYFRIGDVARLCEVPAYVLRFWETEFPQLKPNKGGTGQRLYRKRDVEMALRIKSLLYDQGYTIPGARQVFKSEVKPAEAKEPKPTLQPAALTMMPAEPAHPELRAASSQRDVAPAGPARRDERPARHAVCPGFAGSRTQRQAADHEAAALAGAVAIPAAIA